MPLRFEHDNGVLAYTAHGDVEFDDGTSMLEAGLRSAGVAGGNSRWHLLFDLRHSTENRESDELRDVADLIATHRDILTGNCAIVASDDLIYGMSRMFQVFMEGLDLHCEVFHEAAEASTWFEELEQKRA